MMSEGATRKRCCGGTRRELAEQGLVRSDLGDEEADERGREHGMRCIGAWLAKVAASLRLGEAGRAMAMVEMEKASGEGLRPGRGAAGRQRA